MTRSSRFISGVGASYIAVVASILYSLAIVPIGLRFLGTEQFGLWMLLVQLSGYLNFIELGVFGSAARIIIDYKDRKGDRAYARIIATASIILVVQGILMMTICWLLAPWAVRLFNIPAPLHDVAIYLLVFLGFATGLTTCFRIFGAILYANQRIDLIWAFTALNSLISLIIIWPLLAAGYGLFALPWSFLAPVVSTIALSWFSCYKLRLLPHNLGFSDVKLHQFRELFKLGTDFFLVNVSNQLLEASQLLIISRTMGLGAAAVWSVSTKLFTLLFQLIAKLENTAVVFFSEMMARGEQEKLKSSFKQMYQVTGALAVCGMIAAVAINPYFVNVWAGPDMLWPYINNWLISALLSINLLLRCHTDLAMHTKRIGFLRWVFLVESLVFISIALWVAPHLGFAGILAVSIICALVFRSVYAMRRTATFFNTPTALAGLQWMSFLWVPLLVSVFLALSVGPIVEKLTSPLGRLLSSVLICLTGSGTIFVLLAIPPDLRSLVFQRTSALPRMILKKLVRQ